MPRTQNGPETDMMTREQFVNDLRDALTHLCDPERLRHSPLADLFDVADRFDTFSALQGLLTEAIESLEPDHGEAPESRSWRIYECLYYRYVQQFGPQEVAEQLGIGLRHLRREQRAAVDVLADRLWQKYRLGNWVQNREAAETTPGVEAKGTAVSATLASDVLATSDVPTINEELAWLKSVPPDSSTPLAETLPTVLELAQPLASRRGVQLDTETGAGLPYIAAHPVAVNQILLSLLGIVIHRVPGGQVRLAVQPEGNEVQIHIRGLEPGPALPSSDTLAMSEDDRASLDLARQLTELSDGRLVVSDYDQALDISLILPTVEQVAVLLIDDNVDTLQLLARYATGTRYHVTGTRDPEEAMELAEALSPEIIVLDVMMPQVDGWKVLGRLSHHPLMERVPILVCTILAQKELALTLGASGFVRKPVTRQDFLAALDQVARAEQEPR
jgi:CheY-like chemotaxis protein